VLWGFNMIIICIHGTACNPHGHATGSVQGAVRRMVQTLAKGIDAMRLLSASNNSLK
jgi:hypothetical protein